MIQQISAVTLRIRPRTARHTLRLPAVSVAVFAALSLAGSALAQPRPLAQAVAIPLCEPGPWEFIQTPTIGNETNIVFDVAGTGPNNVWAVGYWSDVPPPFQGSAIRTLILHFDGEVWSVVPSPSPDPDPATPFNQLDGVAVVSANDAVAVGSYSPVGAISQALSMRWDGSTWSEMSSPSSPGGSAFSAAEASRQGSVWAAGLIQSGTSLSRGLLARRIGNGWQTLVSPQVGTRTNTFRGLAALRDNSLWCVGNWGNTAGQFRILLQKWNGSSWTTFNVPSPGAIDSLEDIVAFSDTNVYAVGYWYHPIEGTQPLIMHFNGAGWTQVQLPLFPDGMCELRAVTARGPNDIHASGTYTDAEGVPRPFILHFDGRSWTQTAPLGPFGAGYEWFRGMSNVAGDLWAVGQYYDGAVMAPLAIRQSCGW